ncbi:hypothetical protein [Chryseobacterium shigense]|uniref:Arabinofuranosyltransferase n=1 Tax=Chryseobacterium shigense TaxID=297244 RepID=A0A841N5A5_9FLAO|nr:hypothetical protein [Chryseobacterium shigense]MBB6371677.1 arabinofuranosyltransferase [Chryseobacterium shigense]
MNFIKDLKFWLMVTIGLIYLALAYHYRWVSSDGLSVVYQSYNVINGLGLVWNFAERTYVSTSPLFTLLSIPLTYISDLFLNLFGFSENKILSIPIFINLLFSGATFFLILKFAYSKSKKLDISKLIILGLCFILLFFSKFFLHYSTSGLENSLSYFVISAFAILAMSPGNSKTIFWLPVAAALVFLTRYDFLLIIAPTMLYYLFRNKITPGFQIMALIVILWFVFSFLYFGNIFPNSFYLKANLDFNQSLYYSRKNLFESKPMFLIIILGLYTSFIANKRIFLGIFSYLIYIFIVRDYMLGRLFTPLIPLCIITIIEFIAERNLSEYKNNFFKIYTPGLIVAGIIFYFLPVIKLYEDKLTKGRYWVSDERAFYLKPPSNFPEMKFRYIKPNPKVTFVDYCYSMLHEPLMVSNNQYNAYYLDPMGLASPFVTYYTKNYGGTGSRPGHRKADIDFLKNNGVFESYVENKNLIKNKNLSELFDDVNIVSKGDIFDLTRIKTIIKLHTHNYKQDIN